MKEKWHLVYSWNEQTIPDVTAGNTFALAAREQTKWNEAAEHTDRCRTLPEELLSYLVLHLVKQACRNAHGQMENKPFWNKKSDPCAEGLIIVRCGWALPVLSKNQPAQGGSCCLLAAVGGEASRPVKPLRSSPGPAGGTLSQRKTGSSYSSQVKARFKPKVGHSIAAWQILFASVCKVLFTFYLL